MRSSSLHLLFCGVVLAALAGCGQPPEPIFALNAKTAALAAPAQKIVRDVLHENFGTPNNLVAWEQFPIDYGKADPAADDRLRHEPGWRLIEGRNLYMVHCLHCHGVAGDGAGPTARFLNPRPRDYRQGVFKFKSTVGGSKPSRADLQRVLEEGIPGTYMPSFVLLGTEKLGIITDYVRWLSMRGEMEEKVAVQLASTGAGSEDLQRSFREKREEDKNVTYEDVEKEVLAAINEDLAANVAEAAQDITDSWIAAEDSASVIIPKSKRPEPTSESLARGKELFLGTRAKCSDCHGPAGRGDGPQNEAFEEIKGSTPPRKYDHPGLHDVWGNIIQPRNLTRGVYRFGRRPVDVYRRLHSGINGTPMPGFSTALKEEELWDVVNYVMSLPFDGRQSAAPEDLATHHPVEERPQPVEVSER